MTTEKEYSPWTLEQTPARVLTFLRAAGTSAEIRGKLASRGYTDSAHEEGWTLLHKVSGHRPVAPPAAPPNNEVRDAINTLDDWDEDGFRLIRAALARRFPAQLQFVLEGLAPARGVGAVLVVKNVLDRLDELETSPAREKSRKEDLAAIDAVETKGVSREERKRLRGLVALAQSAVTPATTPPTTEVAPPLQEDLKELKAWFEEWSETARVTIKRRDHLIRLGLAKRKTKKKDE